MSQDNQISPNATNILEDKIGGVEERTLLDVLVYFWCHKRVFTCAIAISLAVGITITILRPSTYTASGAFIPQYRKNPIGNLSSLASQFGLNLLSDDGAQSPQFYVMLLKSPSILRSVVLSPYSFKDSGESQTGDLVYLYHIKKPSRDVAVDAAIRRLSDNIHVTTDQKTGVVSFSVVSRNAILAAAIAQNLFGELNRFNLYTRQSQSGAERAFAQRRLNEAMAELRSAENAMQQFEQQNRDVSAPRLQLERNRLSRVIAMRQDVVSTLAQAYEQARIDEVRDIPVLTLIEKPQVPPEADSRRLIVASVLWSIIGLFLGVLWTLRTTAVNYFKEKMEGNTNF